MEDKYVYNFATQERMSCFKNDDQESLSELEMVKKELEFYKSLFKTHYNSAVYNLSIKKKNGENVWVDHVIDNEEYLLSLDQDKEIEEWLKPAKPSR
tara:strand:- start:201 stop:491 length:291 start_codon:yes stop_codon:yes gene_type:complete